MEVTINYNGQAVAVEVTLLICAVGVCSVIRAALVKIGTAYVDFENSDLFLRIKALAAFGKFLGRKSVNICNYLFVKALFEFRQFLIYNLFDSGILKTDRVDKPRRAFCNSRSRISETRFYRRAFKAERTENINIIKLCKFISVAECAARRNYRVVKLKSRKIYSCISHITTLSPLAKVPVRPCRYAYIRILSYTNSPCTRRIRSPFFLQNCTVRRRPHFHCTRLLT